jgi:hypothetical protein
MRAQLSVTFLIWSLKTPISIRVRPQTPSRMQWFLSSKTNKTNWTTLSYKSRNWPTHNSHIHFSRRKLKTLWKLQAATTLIRHHHRYSRKKRNTMLKLTLISLSLEPFNQWTSTTTYTKQSLPQSITGATSTSWTVPPLKNSWCHQAASFTSNTSPICKTASNVYQLTGLQRWALTTKRWYLKYSTDCNRVRRQSSFWTRSSKFRSLRGKSP